MLHGMEYFWKYVLPTEASSEAREGGSLSQRYVEGSAVGKVTFSHKFCFPLPSFIFSTNLLHSFDISVIFDGTALFSFLWT